MTHVPRLWPLVAGAGLVGALVSCGDSSPSEPPPSPERPVISGSFLADSPVFFGDRSSYEGNVVASPGVVTSVRVGDREYSSGVFSGESDPLGIDTCLEAVVRADNEGVSSSRTFSSCVSVLEPVGEADAVVSSEVAFDEPVMYGVAPLVLSPDDGEFVLDSLVMSLGGDRRVYSSLPVSGEFVHGVAGAEVSVEGAVYGQYLRNGLVLPIERSFSSAVTVGPELAFVDFDVGLFYAGGVNDGVAVSVLDSLGATVSSGVPVDGRLSLRVPVSDRLLFSVEALDDGLIHRIGGVPSEFHLASSGGVCSVTDAYVSVLDVPFPSDVVRLESVPTSVSILLAAHQSGRRSSGFAVGGVVVGTGFRGSFVSLDRRSPHRLYVIEGVASGNPFEMRALTSAMRAYALEAVSAEHRLFSHPSIPAGCHPYGSSLSEVEDFLRFEFISAREFLDDVWTGTVGGGGIEPTHPSLPDFVHVVYNQGRARAAPEYSLDTNRVRMVRSFAGIPMNGTGQFLSENKRLAPDDSRLEGVTSYNDRSGNLDCRAPPDDFNIQPRCFDAYAAPFTVDEVGARLFGHVFSVAMEKQRDTRFHIFRDEDDHWISATRLDGLVVPSDGSGYVWSEGGFFVR